MLHGRLEMSFQIYRGKMTSQLALFFSSSQLFVVARQIRTAQLPSRVVAAVRPGTGSEEAVWLQLIIRGGRKYKLPSFSFFLHWRCSFCHSAVERKDFWSQANEEVVCVGLIRQQMIHTAAGKICGCQLELDKVKVNLVDSWNIKISL